MYPPPHHQDDHRDHLIEVIKTYPLAAVISVKDDEPLVTHLPLIYANNKLIGHIDINNPQAALMANGHKVTVIFSGPQCYISPSIYSTTQLPTWNYVKVHLKGTVQAIDDPMAVKQSIVSMTEHLEAPTHKFQLPLDHPRMHALIDYIKGFEITISHWEGKFKLSQDKNPKDIRNARAELIRANQESIQRFLDSVFTI
ncbi:FMN-binding negative transcriptional regulator [Subsaxibacter sp. CAU 1640]|uniref:FMN-binding negative transcriptional regulator n=1 Tax=Subsaxibacter sp. CAU 1640 TaxID=2933271 RepID=UPI0020038462|nr:FMN-binding negative transcriptional regulator [Subsaxibacter sp. CAU 1640]MCK7591933.1 FMN-binding negative transcriptional regulator [Subsaxibacter sp. CAU 1640]